MKLLCTRARGLVVNVNRCHCHCNPCPCEGYKLPLPSSVGWYEIGAFALTGNGKSSAQACAQGVVVILSSLLPVDCCFVNMMTHNMENPCTCTWGVLPTCWCLICVIFIVNFAWHNIQKQLCAQRNCYCWWIAFAPPLLHAMVVRISCKKGGSKYGSKVKRGCSWFPWARRMQRRDWSSLLGNNSGEGQRWQRSSLQPCCVAVYLESLRCDGFVCASSPQTSTWEEYDIVSWQVCSGDNGKLTRLHMITFEWCNAAPWRYCNHQMLTLNVCEAVPCWRSEIVNM